MTVSQVILRSAFGFVVGMLFFLTAVSADFNIGSNGTYVYDNYLGGDVIKGTVNMSFTDQKNENFSAADFKGGLSLLDFLSANGKSKGTGFSCKPLSCNDSYVQIGEVMENFGEEFSGERYLGLIVKGNIDAISSLEFNVSSTATESTTNQISIDLLDDGVEDFRNSEYVNKSWWKDPNFGCFLDGDGLDYAFLNKDTSAMYCERIDLPSAPAYFIGAEVSGAEGPSIEFYLYNFSNSSASQDIGGCRYEIPSTGLPADGMINCTVIPKKSVAAPFAGLVCARLSDEKKSDFKIKFQTGGDSICGGKGNPKNGPIELKADYQIFAMPLMYAPVKEIKFDSKYFSKVHGSEVSLPGILTSYIERVYGDVCPSDGCVIPLKIKVGSETRTIFVNNTKVKYANEVSTLESKGVYDIKKIPFTISANFSVLDLSQLGFTAPDKNGKHNFVLKLGNEKVLSKEINSKVGFNFDVQPRFAPIGQPILFTVSGNKNVSSSAWNFGDGSIQTNSSNRITHLYRNSGEFDMEVTVIATDGTSSTKKFTVLVGGAKPSANKTLSDKFAQLERLETSISTLDPKIKEILTEKLNIEAIKTSLNQQKKAYEQITNTGTDEQFGAIISALLSLEIPSEVFVSESGSLPADVGYSNIDPSLAAELAGKTVKSSEQTKKDIIFWLQENMEIEVSFETFSVMENRQVSPILAKYVATVTPKKSIIDRPDMFIDYSPSSIVFLQSVTSKKLSGETATSLKLDPMKDKAPQTVSFIIVSAQPPKIESLGIYVSPSFERIPNIAPAEICDIDDPECQGGTFPWAKFFIAMGVLIFVFLIAYVVAQEWYKKKYQAHLFKNPDELYNVINFIYNSRVSGMKDQDIQKKLQEKKWTKEQVKFAFNKIDGKRTGMWEIPIFKFAENKKVRQEIEKKQPDRRVDARFIKRPRF